MKTDKEKLMDPDRVKPEGKRLGECMVRLTEPEIERLAANGEPDDRCKTCAFRNGTIPNGCPQTQMDALKCVMEGEPFFCHTPRVDQPADIENVICHGWYAARHSLVTGNEAAKMKVLKTPWPFSNDPEYSEKIKSSSKDLLVKKDSGEVLGG